MVSIGGLLIVFGIGSLLLPLIDFQFTLMSFLDDYQPVAGIVVAAIGAVLVFVGMQRQKAQTVAAAAAAPAPMAPVVAPPDAAASASAPFPEPAAPVPPTSSEEPPTP